MIRGLEKFKERFAGLEDQYVLIGGTATWLLLDAAGIEPRATKDLDIVLCLEALDSEFGKAFWAFVREGGYENRQATTDKPIFYRFSKPKDDTFPFMLELLSRAPDGMDPPGDVHLTRIPVDEDVYSLSAILLDGAYYKLLHEHKIMEGGLPIVNVQGLIPLKAMAWLNLTDQKAKDGTAKKGDINKHRGDVLRLHQLLVPENGVVIPDDIKKDMARFVEELTKATDLDLRHFGLGSEITLESVIFVLKKVYGI